MKFEIGEERCRHNTIGAALFDIRFDTETCAFAEQALLETFTRKQLMPAIDEIIEKNSPGYEVITIESLDIDIGPVRYKGFRDEIIRRVKERLDALLKEKIFSIRHRGTGGERVLSKEVSEFSQLRKFLITGLLPWPADIKRDQNLENRFLSILSSHPGPCLSFLKESVTKGTVIQRLVRQFSEEVLTKIVRLLAPRRGDELIQSVRGIGDTRLWEQLLISLLHKGENGVEKRAPHERERELPRLKAILINAMTGGSTNDFNRVWKKLIKDYARETTETIYLYGQRARVRKKISRTFSERQIGELVCLIEPEESGFIGSFTEKTEIYKDIKEIENAQTGVFKQQLWEFILTYLLVERGSRFNKKIFTQSVIHQIASHYNRTYEDLLKTLTQIVSKSEVETGRQEEIFSILRELGKDMVREGRLRREPEPAHQDMFRAYDLANALRHYMYSGILPSAPPHVTAHVHPQEIIDILKRKHPGMLLQLFKELQLRPRLLTRVSDNLTGDTLKSLVEAFIFVSSPIEEKSLSTLKEAFSLFEKKTGRRHLFYHKVLQQIVTGGVIDLEKISREMRLPAKPDPVTFRGVNGVSTGDTELSLKDGTFGGEITQEGEKLFSFLKGEIRAGKYQQPVLVRTIETMIEDEPDRLYRFVKQYSQTKQAADRLITLLPERLLTRVLYLLAPASFLAILGCADMLLSACLSPGVVKRPWNIKRHKWAFIFHYLRKRKARPFDEKEFIRGFVKFLADKEGGRERGRFYSRISRRLARDIRPSNQEKYQTAIRIISQIASQERNATPQKSPSPHETNSNPDPESPRSFVGPDDLMSEVNKEHSADRGEEIKNSPDTIQSYLVWFLERGETTRGSISYTHLLEFLIRNYHRQYLDFIFFISGSSELTSSFLQLTSHQLLQKGIPLVLSRLWRQPSRDLLKQTDIIVSAFLSTGTSTGKERGEDLIWGFLFQLIRNTGYTRLDKREYIRRLVEYLVLTADKENTAHFYQMLKEQFQTNIPSGEGKESLDVIDGIFETIDSLLPVKDIPTQKPLSSLKGPEEPEEEFAEKIYIANAGMVIASPYLPRLFKMLGLLDETAFKDREAAERGVHLLQYMVNGMSSSPEYQLVLNKILCGVKPGRPVIKGIEITDKEREMVEGAIQGMIQNWKILGKTSVKGFRESFLMREGRLRRKDNKWFLKVEQRSFDMLLDQIPWTFSTIKHPWMDRVLFVEWR